MALFWFYTTYISSTFHRQALRFHALVWCSFLFVIYLPISGLLVLSPFLPSLPLLFTFADYDGVALLHTTHHFILPHYPIYSFEGGDTRSSPGCLVFWSLLFVGRWFGRSSDGWADGERLCPPTPPSRSFDVYGLFGLIRRLWRRLFVWFVCFYLSTVSTLLQF